MNPSQPVKIITLSTFTLLIICFVGYRAGAFESFFNSNAETAGTSFDTYGNSMAVDTPGVKTDSVQKPDQVKEIEMMSSSKSMIIPKFKTDTVKKNNNAPGTDTLKKTPQPKTIMGSSKSGFIYQPEPDTISKPKK